MLPKGQVRRKQVKKGHISIRRSNFGYLGTLGEAKVMGEWY